LVSFFGEAKKETPAPARGKQEDTLNQNVKRTKAKKQKDLMNNE
jgi:hypothetical protein